MKIGIDIRPLMEKPYFGVGEYTFHLLDNLFKIDQKNEYFLFYNSLKSVTENLPKWDYPHVKFIGFRWPNKFFNLSQKFFHLPKVDKLIKGGVDVFFLPNQHFISLSSDCYKVITVHDLTFEQFPEFFTFKRRLWHKLVNLKKLTQEFDKIISVSQSTADDLVNLYGLKRDKIVVIHSGLFKDKIDEDTINRVKIKYNLPKEFIFCLGRLEPRKNISGLILAFDKLIEEIGERGDDNSLRQLLIAGSPGWLWRTVQKAIKKVKHKNNIRFIGYLPEKDKFAFYHLATLFVYPSFYEGFGFPVLEAMGCGCPVITSFSSSLPELVNSAGILVDPDNLISLKEAMKKLLLEKELREKLSEEGLIQARKFDWQQTARKTLEVLSGI